MELFILECHIRHLCRDGIAAVIGRMRDINKINLEFGNEAANNIAHIIQVQTAVQKFFGADSNAHRLITNGSAHRRQSFPYKPHSVVKTTAIFISSLVRDWRKKLLQQMSVCQLQLNSIESGFQQITGNIRMRLNDHCNFLMRHWVRCRCSSRPWNGGCRPSRHARKIAVNMPSKMQNLTKNLGTFRLHSFGNIAEPRNCLSLVSIHTLLPAKR